MPWNEITFVVLVRDKMNWCEFSGCVADGFSARYAEQGQEHVISQPPGSLAEGIRLLTLYLHEDDRWRSDYDWQ